MKKMLALALCLCFLLGGCARTAVQDDGALTPYQTLALRLAAAPDGEDGAAVDGAYAPAFADFTCKTAQQLLSGAAEENAVYAPANLYLALCMLAETAGGDTRAQLLKLLGLSDADDARAAADALWRALCRDGETDKTLLANSLWLNAQCDYRAETVETLADDYHASVFRAPMGDAATDAAIADWINENTNRLLADAAGAAQTTPETLLMLLSTLYFKGTWREQFDAAATREDTFTSAGGAAQSVEFMQQTENGEFYRVDRYTAAPLYFRDGKAMWFLLPDEGTALQDIWTLAWSLPMIAVDTRSGCYEGPDLRAMLGAPRYGEIHWHVPKFDIDGSTDLIGALEKLGVTDAFDPDAADFSPLSDTPAVVSAARHAARVTVDENGCEAAAFTEITVEATAVAPEELPVIEMNLNRPFGFLITGADGLPLFMGVVNTIA